MLHASLNDIDECLFFSTNVSACIFWSCYGEIDGRSPAFAECRQQ